LVHNQQEQKNRYSNKENNDHKKIPLINDEQYFVRILDVMLVNSCCSYFICEQWSILLVVQYKSISS